jgi:endoglucanase
MNKEFLYTLLDSPSVSGHEIGLQKKVIEEMKPWAHEIRTDYTGNVISVLNPDAPFKVMLAAHIDEIGLIVTHIQENGLVRVARAGGIRPLVYPGHQVVLCGYKDTVYGAVVHSDAMQKKELKQI